MKSKARDLYAMAFQSDEGKWLFWIWGIAVLALVIIGMINANKGEQKTASHHRKIYDHKIIGLE